MMLLEDWQYKYVEKCLRDYYILKNSTTETDVLVCKAIDRAIEFFKGSQHDMIMREFYFKHSEYEKKYTVLGHHNRVFIDKAGRTTPNGYFIRREIMYKVAMYFYSIGVFKFEDREC